MVGKLVRSEIAQQLLSDLVWKLHHRVKPSSLTSVFQQIESRKAHLTLRSAEWIPTLSAAVNTLPSPHGEGFFLMIPALAVINNFIPSPYESRWAYVPFSRQRNG